MLIVFIVVFGMSWITNLADKAENLLNKIDSEAATALSIERRGSNASSHTSSQRL